MPETKLPDEEKRQAVVVGINEYDDSNIPNLKGAENDAKDIYERLKDPNIGNFEILDEHYLTGESATCEAIRKAISDLLWQTDPCDLTLFYFSGHGFRDGHQNGYIAPFDMSKSEPFVKGINMGELKQVMLDSINRSIVLMILDCCHSGIPTKGYKAIPDVKAIYDTLFKICVRRKEEKVRSCLHQAKQIKNQEKLNLLMKMNKSNILTESLHII